MGGLKSYCQNLGHCGAKRRKFFPVAKTYDAEHKGRCSAGRCSRPKAGKTSSKQRHAAKLPIEVSEKDPD
jgi:hypothetical protein